MHRKRVEQRFRIGVLMGGKSVENEVSFNSGRTFCDHIDISCYSVVPIFQCVSGELYLLPWRFLHRGKTADFIHRLKLEAKRIEWDDLKEVVDFVYIAMHGRYAEDGTIQGFLEILKIPYIGTKVLGSALGMNKVFQKEMLGAYGVDVPNGLVLTSDQVKNMPIAEILQRITALKIMFPFVVKPVLEGSSFGVSVVTCKEKLIPALKKAAWQESSHEQSVLIEEKIEGMEFACISLQRSKDMKFNKGEDECWLALPVTEIKIEEGISFYDYDQKYMPGRATKITPARCTDEEMRTIQNTCILVNKILSFSTESRIDGFLTKEKRVVIIDPNSLSGMSPASFLFHQAAEVDLNHTQLINYLISVELEITGLNRFVMKKEKKNRLYGSMEKTEKKKIAVLLGGGSNELEVSLESGRNVCYKLSPSKYDVIPIFVNENNDLFRLSSKLLIQNSAKEISSMLTNTMQVKWADLSKLCDFVFIGLHGGDGENGNIQGALEMLGVPYNGPGVLTSALCIDKHKVNSFLEKKGFAVPKARIISEEFYEKCKVQKNLEKHCENIVDELLLPLILKPYNEGCSFRVKKICNEKELLVELDSFFKTGRKAALLEEYLLGMELTCGVIGNEKPLVFPPSMVVAHSGILSIEEKFLIGIGENQTPAPLPQETLELIKDIVKDVYITVGCKGYSRIDCFYQNAKISPTKKERVVILEINTLPALTPATCLFHQAAELDIRPMELIDKIVELGFENHKYLTKHKVVRKKSIQLA